MSDPLRIHHRRLWSARGMGLAAVLVAAWYGLAPLDLKAVQPWLPPVAQQESRLTSAELPLDPFRTARLIPNEPLSTTTDPVTSPTALSDLALIGIVQSGDVRRAAIFIARENKLRVAGVGDSVGSAIVRSIDDRGVELSMDSGVARLDLVRTRTSGGS